MLHIGRRADGFLDGIHDALFDIEWRGAFVDDTDKGDRDLNVREQIDGQAIQRGGTEHDHRQRQHQDADAIA
jgi:hypothetical protein